MGLLIHDRTGQDRRGQTDRDRDRDRQTNGQTETDRQTEPTKQFLLKNFNNNGGY